MSVGVPYMFSDDGSYHELADEAGIYYKDSDDFLELINKVLDDDEFRNEFRVAPDTARNPVFQRLRASS